MAHYFTKLYMKIELINMLSFYLRNKDSFINKNCQCLEYLRLSSQPYTKI